jgi:hypothetical protein
MGGFPVFVAALTRVRRAAALAGKVPALTNDLTRSNAFLPISLMRNRVAFVFASRNSQAGK